MHRDLPCQPAAARAFCAVAGWLLRQEEPNLGSPRRVHVRDHAAPAGGIMQQGNRFTTDGRHVAIEIAAQAEAPGHGAVARPGAAGEQSAGTAACRQPQRGAAAAGQRIRGHADQVRRVQAQE